ncbi:MAG: alpha/beta hydrolase [Thermoanaerobaculia bacterium]
MISRTLETAVHGRYLFEDRGAQRVLVGFHGYAETAETHLAELEKIPGIEDWSVVAIQALHPFYTRSGSIVASWMTSLDRERAIADNIAWVRRVVADLPTPDMLVFAGFSQGAAMAARAAAYAAPAVGLMLLGGDIPPEIHEDPDVTLPPTLLARGRTDDWYTEEKFNKDLKYLEEKKIGVRPFLFAGGHEWTDEFRDAASQFLRSLS